MAFAAPRIELVLGLGESELVASLITKGAVGAASAAADWLASKALTEDQYARYKASPVGGINLAATVNDMLKSDAEAYFEMVTSIGMSSTGVSVLDKLTPKPLNQRVAVSIYEFHSQVSQITEGSATDMFITALVKSRQFRVVERNRLNESIGQEKRINAAGQTTGNTAQHALRGAQYLFEGAVTEANAGVQSGQGGINICGLQLGGSKGHDTVSIDVRILDADTGDVLDSVTVSRCVKASSVGISGTAALVSTVVASHGGSASPYTPDVSVQNSKQAGIDATVRACIEDAVWELAKRVDLPAAHE